MARVVEHAGLVCCVVGFVCSILALALPFWQIFDNNGLEINIGLWRYCSEFAGVETCGDTLDLTSISENDKDSLRATRGIITLGLISIIGAILNVVFRLCVKKAQKACGVVGGLLALTADPDEHSEILVHSLIWVFTIYRVSIFTCFFLMVAMGVYANNLELDDYDYSAGFAFDIIGWLMDWLAGAMVLFSTIQDKGEVDSS